MHARGNRVRLGERETREHTQTPLSLSERYLSVIHACNLVAMDQELASWGRQQLIDTFKCKFFIFILRFQSEVRKHAVKVDII